MSMISVLKTGGRAALVAVALSASALVAMPAQAAGPNITFGLQLGTGGGFGGNGIFLNFNNGPQLLCLSDKQIRAQLREEGWEMPKIVKKLSDRKVVVIAYWDEDPYQMRVDRCTGKVDKVRPVQVKSNGAFSITLSF